VPAFQAHGSSKPRRLAGRLSSWPLRCTAGGLPTRAVAVRDAERRAGEALRAMIDDEGLSVREAVDWCGSGITARELTRLRRLHGGQQDGGQEGRVG
jgi:hypothetical protein